MKTKCVKCTNIDMMGSIINIDTTKVQILIRSFEAEMFF